MPAPPPDKAIPDGKLRRWDYAKRQDKRCWAKLYEFISPKNGKQYISGAFGVWGVIETQLVRHSGDAMDAEERAAFMARQAQQLQDQLHKEEQDRARAAKVGLAMWRKASPSGYSQYLAKKGLGHFNANPEGFKFLDGSTLVVPMLRYDFQPGADNSTTHPLVGVQTIPEEGKKLFTKGAPKSGTACRLGPAPRPRQHIFLCEGFATGLSIRLALAMQNPVFVCWDAHNLKVASLVLRTLYPSQPMVICADDDWKTTKKDLSTGRVYFYNAGLVCAYEAAQQCQPNVCYTKPSFAALPPGVKRLDDWTDFNDMHQHVGLEAVAESLQNTIRNWRTLK